MPKQKSQYCIKSCPSDDTEQLENLLNTMSSEGWDLYTMHEAEGDDGFCFNCIFIRDPEDDEREGEEDFDESFGYKTAMQKIISAQNEPYERCVDIQRKIRDKRNRIQKIKSLIDETSEDQRYGLNEEMFNTMEELKRLRKQLQEVISPDIMNEKIGQEKLSLQLSEEILELVNPDTDDVNLIAKTVKLRQQLAEELGYIIPKIKFENSEILQANEFSIDVRGISAVCGRVYPGYLMYFKDELNLEKIPKDAIKDNDVISGKPVIWLSEEKTKSFWTEGLDASSVIVRAMEYVCIKYADTLFDYTDLNRYIEIVSTNNLFLIENIIPDYVSVAELKFLLTSLIKERVSIKDIMFIFEKINDFADEDTKEDLLEKLRHALARTISKSVANENNVIQAFELSEEHLKYFESKLTGKSDVIRFDNTKLKSIAANITKALEKHEISTPEVVLIVPMGIRHIASLVLSRVMYNLRVIAREEVADEFSTEIVDRV